MGLYEDHAAHRDKFEVFVVHDESVKSLAELDKKLPRLKARYWQGKDLPFPVLLDAASKTEQLYGIRAHPTGLLIDPDGKLVGEASVEDLEAKLPPLPAAKKWARHRDMYANVHWVFEATPLKAFANIGKNCMNCAMDLDADAIRACGLT